MKLMTWEVDDANIVNLKIGGFGKNSLTVNGMEVPGRLRLRKKSEFPFELSDGRNANILINPRFASRRVIELRVDGQLMVESGEGPFLCDSCGTTVKPNDRFCGVCGHAMPPAEHYVHRRHIKEATTAITVLAVLFLFGGVVMFFITKSHVADALIRLNGLNPNEIFPKSINGVTYTVAVLREQLIWEPWSILIQNSILAAIMAGLAFWGKRSPLAAVLIATAIYAVVIVTHAIINPQSIGQGVFMKIIIIACLIRGIKSALALNTADA
jgi:hypothetical protein